MHNGHNPQWLFVWRVGDKVVVLVRESQWPSGEIGAAIASMRKWYQSLNGVQNIGNHVVSGGGAILGDEISNLRKVVLYFRVKIVPGHCRLACRAALRARKRAFISSPLMGFTLPLLRSS